MLVGGEGTRLRPLTLDVPKPALRLVDRPFIRYMTEWLGHHGVDEVIMACGFRAEDLRQALGEGGNGGPVIRYLQEDEPLGTAGPIRLAADRGMLEERFMVLNGDVLTDLDLSALTSMHEERGASATLGLYPVDDPTHYGLVVREGGPSAPGEEPPDPGGAVLEFLEKPDPEAIATDEISAGAYVLEGSVLDLIPVGRAVSIEREVFPKLVGKGLYGRRLTGYWLDIGTPERYLRASWDILERRVHTDVRPSGAGILIEDGASVAVGAMVGPRAVIRAGSRVEAGAAIVESVLLGENTIGAGAEVEGAILATGVEVEEAARVERGAVIGRAARIASGALVGEGARVAPEEVVAK